MRLRKIQQRVEGMEDALSDSKIEEQSRSVRRESPEFPNPKSRLHDSAQDAFRILKRAMARGDYHTALAAIREICRTVELLAKLQGELDEKPTTNILNLNIDPDTAKRVVEIYAKRHKSLVEEAK